MPLRDKLPIVIHPELTDPKELSSLRRNARVFAFDVGEAPLFFRREDPPLNIQSTVIHRWVQSEPRNGGMIGEILGLGYHTALPMTEFAYSVQLDRRFTERHRPGGFPAAFKLLHSMMKREEDRRYKRLRQFGRHVYIAYRYGKQGEVARCPIKSDPPMVQFTLFFAAAIFSTDYDFKDAEWRPYTHKLCLPGR